MPKLAPGTTSPVGATSGFRRAARAVQTKLSKPGVVTKTAHHPAGDVICCHLAGYAMVEWVLSTLRLCGLRCFGDPRTCTCSGLLEAEMPDHGDHAVGKHDLTDLYVFRKPGDPAKTILVMGMTLT